MNERDFAREMRYVKCRDALAEAVEGLIVGLNFDKLYAKLDHHTSIANKVAEELNDLDND